MLRNTFGEIVEMVRDEARLSTNTSRGIDFLNTIKRKVRTHYTCLAEDYAWPHLRVRRGDADATKVLAAGQRYYDLPTKLNPQFIDGAWILYGSTWCRIEYGIGNEHYSYMDSDSDQRVDPVERWALYSNDSLNQFEVWPIPASDGQKIAFEGMRTITPYVEDSDRCDIDDMALAFHVAAEVCMDEERRKILAARAQSRLDQLMMNARGSQSRTVMGGVDPNVSRPHRPREIKYVRSR